MDGAHVHGQGAASQQRHSTPKPSLSAAHLHSPHVKGALDECDASLVFAALKNRRQHPPSHQLEPPQHQWETSGHTKMSSSTTPVDRCTLPLHRHVRREIALNGLGAVGGHVMGAGDGGLEGAGGSAATA